MSESMHDARLQAARARAAARGLEVRNRKSPPWGFELRNLRGEVLDEGTLTDMERAISSIDPDDRLESIG
ncbi:hypothetical protein [Nocardia sp. NPDC057227]|uniref:hypothetical protein n=1 Tax=Nocardia sp. NPDC057227 TaxID=3346056 RepID=UPI00362712F3